MEQPDRVHRPPLAEPIDAADALLEPQRIPRQLDIDDEPAAVMQVQALAGGIGRDEHVDAAVVERVDGRAPLVRRQAAVDASRPAAPTPDRAATMASSVSRYSVKMTAGSRAMTSSRRSRRIFELVRAAVRQRDQLLERRSLFVDALEPARRQHRIRLEVVRRSTSSHGNDACAGSSVAFASSASRRASVRAIAALETRRAAPS